MLSTQYSHLRRSASSNIKLIYMKTYTSLHFRHMRQALQIAAARRKRCREDYAGDLSASLALTSANIVVFVWGLSLHGVQCGLSCMSSEEEACLMCG